MNSNLEGVLVRQSECSASRREHLLPRKSHLNGGSGGQKSYLERETGLEPATLCLGRLGAAF
jgi:hypothetical protein